MKCLAVLVVLGLAGVLAAQTAPNATAAFKEAQAAAAQLPTPVAELERSWILHDELAAQPKQALSDYRSLYAEVHAWPAGGRTTEEKYLAELRFDIEGNAINAFAAQGQFQQALAWLANPHREHGRPAGYYSDVIREMVRRGDLAQVELAIQQCVSRGGGYPFSGAAAALSSKLPAGVREAIADAGVAAARTAAAEDAFSAEGLLAEVHKEFPNRDGDVVIAILALLQSLQNELVLHPNLAIGDEINSAKLNGLLGQINRELARRARAEFPATAGPPPFPTRPPSMTDKLLAIARNDPDAALAGAAKIRDLTPRFAALASLAQALAKPHPRRAQQAADDADALLDEDVARAQAGLVVNLAQAYQALGESAKADAIAATALSADAAAANAEKAYDLSTSEGAFKAYANVRGRYLGIIPWHYGEVGAFAPALALRHARACYCAFYRPLMIAQIAKALASVGAPGQH